MMRSRRARRGAGHGGGGWRQRGPLLVHGEETLVEEGIRAEVGVRAEESVEAGRAAGRAPRRPLQTVRGRGENECQAIQRQGPDDSHGKEAREEMPQCGAEEQGFDEVGGGGVPA